SQRLQFLFDPAPEAALEYHARVQLAALPDVIGSSWIRQSHSSQKYEYMLRSLHIRDFVIVEQTELHFDAGFSVFTGETGAGKSILIDALALTLGARGDSGAIREGAAKADISAIFDVPASLHPLLAELELDDDELVLRRVIDRSGKSRAF